MALEVFFDGLLSEPRLDHPEGIAVHPDGSVWRGGERGQIIGSRTAPSSRSPRQWLCLVLAIDSQANLYVCDLAHAALFRLPACSDQPELFVDGADGRLRQRPHRPARPRHLRLPRRRGRPPLASRAVQLRQRARFRPRRTCALRRGDMEPAEHGDRRRTRQRAGVVPCRGTAASDAPRRVGDRRTGRLVVTCYDPDGHVLCHPTNAAFLGADLLVANLGRWHLSRIPAVGRGAPLPPVRRRT